MVFLDENYWTVTKPIYPLLTGLAAGRPYATGVGAFDDVESIVHFIEQRQ
jgi:hypothetical protein